MRTLLTKSFVLLFILFFIATVANATQPKKPSGSWSKVCYKWCKKHPQLCTASTAVIPEGNPDYVPEDVFNPIFPVSMGIEGYTVKGMPLILYIQDGQAKRYMATILNDQDLVCSYVVGEKLQDEIIVPADLDRPRMYLSTRSARPTQYVSCEPVDEGVIAHLVLILQFVDLNPISSSFLQQDTHKFPMDLQ